MFITSVIIVLVVMVALIGIHRHRSLRSSSRPAKWLRPARGMGAALLAVTTSASLFVAMGTANAVIVATIDLGTASNFSVLAGTTVTNSGNSVLAGGVGVSPGTAITGFPPGTAATIEGGTSVATNAQAASTAAYLDALNRPVDFTVAADLTGLTLVGGVYSAAAKAPLSLPGTLTLDGEGNPNTVFIFQTDSTLITGPGSTVSLINGAQACNVFWQVGSSATLDTGSTFVGNILALTTITVADSVTVQGRALAQNGAVTLLNDNFTSVGCDLAPVTTTTVGATTTTLAGTTTTVAGGASGGTTPTTTPTSLPFTGQNSIEIVLVAMVLLSLGIGALGVSRRLATVRD
jgi:hypothetical protein